MGKSVSITLGKGSLNHNNRVFCAENVDPLLTPNNVVLVHQQLEDAYCEIFGEALELYNQKQVRKDRQIPDYLEHIRQSKNGEKEFYEIIVQVGDRYDTGIKTADAPLAKKILMQYYQEFIGRNPNMRVFNAVIHMDEKDGTPHMHMDFIPVATGQKRGLEIKNSMRQALKQQGFDFKSTQAQLNNPDITATYSKPVSRIGGGRWLDEERRALGAILKQHGIVWDYQGIKRDHLTIKEYKACAELIEKEIKQTSPTELIIREPNFPMKLVGVKENEIIVLRSSAEDLQRENSTLRMQAQIDKTTIQKMDNEKNSADAFIRRALKEAGNIEQDTNQRIKIAYQETEMLKRQYSQGTASEYKKLVGKLDTLVKYYRQRDTQFNIIKQEKEQIDNSFSDKVKKAVEDATNYLREENSHLTRIVIDLKSEVELWKQKAINLKMKVNKVSQTLFDVIRAIFALKYNRKDKQPNPYRSTLTESASCLIDALERKSRTALLDAGQARLEKGLDSMDVSVELENDVKKQFRQLRQRQSRSYEIGD